MWPVSRDQVKNSDVVIRRDRPGKLLSAREGEAQKNQECDWVPGTKNTVWAQETPICWRSEEMDTFFPTEK